MKKNWLKKVVLFLGIVFCMPHDVGAAVGEKKEGRAERCKKFVRAALNDKRVRVVTGIGTLAAGAVAVWLVCRPKTQLPQVIASHYEGQLEVLESGMVRINTADKAERGMLQEESEYAAKAAQERSAYINSLILNGVLVKVDGNVYGPKNIRVEIKINELRGSKLSRVNYWLSQGHIEEVNNHENAYDVVNIGELIFDALDTTRVGNTDLSEFIKSIVTQCRQRLDFFKPSSRTPQQPSRGEDGSANAEGLGKFRIGKIK